MKSLASFPWQVIFWKNVSFYWAW